MFSGCPSVSASVRASVRPSGCSVRTISYKPVDGISPNFDYDVVEGTNRKTD